MKRDYIYIIVILIIGLTFWLVWTEKSNEHDLKVSQLNGKLKLSLSSQDAAKTDLKALYDTLKTERAKTREKVVVKLVYREKLREAAKEELNKAPETIINLVAADDSLTITFMQALDKCESGYDTLKTKFTVYQESTDSVRTNFESLIKEQEKALKRSRRISRLKTIGMGACFVIGVLVVI